MGNTDKNNGTIIIFSHYGFSSFLKYTLACARFTNPKARLIFLGDENNRSVACQEGWEHYLFKDYKGILMNVNYYFR